jgi:hypothetical protein
MSRTTKKVLALTAASGLAVVGFFLTKPAFAGTNGQQLKVCQKQSENYTEMYLEGTNQNGDFTSAVFDITPGGCGTTSGYYWVGDVIIRLRSSDTDLPRAVACKNIPKVQESGDEMTCNL